MTHCKNCEGRPRSDLTESAKTWEGYEQVRKHLNSHMAGGKGHVTIPKALRKKKDYPSITIVVDIRHSMGKE